MSKKKLTITRKSVDRQDGPAASSNTTPSTKVTAKPAAIEPWQEELRDRLQFTSDYNEVTVVQFRAFSGLAHDAKRVLDQSVDQGLVSRPWRSAAGQYSLTDAGKAKLAELS